MEDIKKYDGIAFTSKKINFRGAPNSRKLNGMCMFNAKENVLKKINISFIVHFCLVKYSFSFNPFFNTLVFKVVFFFKKSTAKTKNL